LATDEPDSAVAVFVPGSNSPDSVNTTSPSTHLEAARISSMESLSMVYSGHTLEPTQPQRVSPAPNATAPSPLNPSISAAYQTTPSVSSFPTTSNSKPDMCIENVAFGTRDESILLKDLNVTAITDHFGELLGKIGTSEDQETLQARLLSVLNSGVVDCPIYTKGIFLFSLPIVKTQELDVSRSTLPTQSADNAFDQEMEYQRLMDDVYVQMNAGSVLTSVSNISTVKRTGILSGPNIASTFNITQNMATQVFGEQFSNGFNIRPLVNDSDLEPQQKQSLDIEFPDDDGADDDEVGDNCVDDDDDEHDGGVADADSGPVHEYVKE
ncbi:hypothetical protein HDU76_011506, partial [Blyttiomyces sp. JEL0837]